MPLPQPTLDETEHSQRLCALIREEISAHGPIDFARYMALALYAPGLGYYSAGKARFGAAGDFVTAPELGGLYAATIARAVAPVLRETHGDFVELGAGSGAFASDLLAALERLDALPARYLVLETSADLRERQRERIDASVPALANRVQHLDRPPQEPWRGVLFANEVVDALPVQRFVARRDGRVAALGVTCDAAGEFHGIEIEADEALRARVERIEHDVAAALGQAVPVWQRPYRSECLPQLAEWFHAVAGMLRRGLALFVDYGYPRAEYYLPERRDGTLVCHYRHRAHDDPFAHVGLQDITAFVDFTALAEAGAAAGFALSTFTSQAQYLLANGLTELLAEAATRNERERMLLAQEVRRLTLPGQMGERFKVMAFSRGVEVRTRRAVDQSHRL
ncbi:MAG TPA: SAM-dependent methyltransferase [Candidatus Saccharimonadia bacterium]|nr:SAM-dependent methyltransferase [Candidatus Saccharimonadia bacterium]